MDNQQEQVLDSSREQKQYTEGANKRKEVLVWIGSWIYRCGETACPEDWKPQVRA